MGFGPGIDELGLCVEKRSLGVQQTQVIELPLFITVLSGRKDALCIRKNLIG